MKTKLHLILIVTLSLVWLILSTDGDVASAAWQPPIGIPRPEFGIEETHLMYEGETYDFGSGLEPYKDAGNGPYTHYVDNTHPDATDTDNPYGTASKPRNTIPRGSAALAAGSVVEIHNSTFPNGWGELQIEGVGTAQRPIFVRGIDMPRLDFRGGMVIGFYGNARYIIVEGISFFKGAVLGRWDEATFETSYIAVRNCDFHGDENGGGVGITSWTSNHLHHIVFYNNVVHDNGIWDPDIAVGDRDIGHIKVDDNASYVWILDNEVYHVESCGIAMGEIYTNPHHIYVGRNIVHHNKQTGLWTKTAFDVIFSENTSYGHRPSSSSYGAGMGFQCDPKRVWFLFNRIYDNEDGIRCGSGQLGGREEFYFIGNVIYDVRDGFDLNGLNTPEPAKLIGNTIYNSENGIANSYYTSKLDIINNIIASSNYYVHLPSAYGSDVISNMSYNLFDGSGEILWGSTYTNLSEFQLATGKGLGCIEADPLFVDALNNDFHLQSTSPAIDAGTSSGVVQEVFDRFEELYGIDIRKDIEGRTRPQGSAWDIGAYEYVLLPVCVIQNEPKEGHPPLTVSFDGSQSKSPHGDIVSYEWDFGDGSTSTGMKTSHIFTSAGEYTVTLTVTDDLGLKAESQTRITVFEKEFGELPAGCYNNVFNPIKGERALIVVELPKQAHVRLNLYNTRGKRIKELADEQKEAGTYKYYWDGKSSNGDVVGSGLYFVHIQAGDYKKTKKIVVIK